MNESWELKTLGELCSFENGDRGKNYPSKSIQTSSGVPFINAGHLTDEGLDLENMNYIPRERFDLLKKGKIRQYDILFCLRGSLGKFASVGELKEGAIASSLVIVRPNEFLLHEFLLAYLKSDLCFNFINKFSNGAAQPNLSAKSLKNFVIPLPPLSEQLRIITILDDAFENISIAKANAQRKIYALDELQKSFLHQAFNGKL